MAITDMAKAIISTPLPPLSLTVAQESWPIAERFAIARGSKTHAHILKVALTDGHGRCTGRGEGVPYARYGETMSDSIAALKDQETALQSGITHEALLARLPAGAARNAIDCALWDYHSACAKKPIWEMLDLPAPTAVETAYTISLDQPDDMANAAHRSKHLPVLKLKLGDPALDAERLTRIRKAAPDARLLIDANEGWSLADLQRLAPHAADLDVELIEQPLPDGQDACLADFHSPVPLCADESFQGAASLADVAKRYQAVNLKLDKAGGFTSLLQQMDEAKRYKLKIFLGCMVATSLAMAPSFILAHKADWVDLDGPLLLARDRQPGLSIKRGILSEYPNGLWGWA